MGIDEPRPSNAACGLGRTGADIRADTNSACPIIPMALVAMSPSSSVCGFFPRLIDRRPPAAAAAPNHTARGCATVRSMGVVLLVWEVRRRLHQLERDDRTVGCRGGLDIAGVSRRTRPIDDGHEPQHGGSRQRHDLLHLIRSFLGDGATGVIPGCVVWSPRRGVTLALYFQCFGPQAFASSPAIRMTSRLGC